MSYGVDEENEVLNDYFIPANLIPVNANKVDGNIDPVDIDVSKFLKQTEKPKQELKGIKVATYEDRSK